MPILTVSRLTKKFKTHTAVDDLSFTVEEGDVYGFLGQNGAGKSTTIRMLLSLVRPTEGEISLFGLDLKKERSRILRQTGAVIEKPDLYPYLSAYENLELFALLSGGRENKKEWMDLLELVGLSGREDDRVKTYSQGMKQRLGIAVALVHQPRLIILDEPVNGLDPQGIADVRNLILHLSRHLGKTVIVSSHLLHEIEQIATRLLIIDQGRKMVEGEMSSLLDPANTLIEVHTDDAEFSWRLLMDTPWSSFIKKKENRTLFFQMHRDKVPELNRELVRLQIPVLSLEVKSSLEAYFLSLTGGKQHVAAFTD